MARITFKKKNQNLRTGDIVTIKKTTLPRKKKLSEISPTDARQTADF